MLIIAEVMLKARESDGKKFTFRMTGYYGKMGAEKYIIC
jgi:hypothetical protein